MADNKTMEPSASRPSAPRIRICSAILTTATFSASLISFSLSLIPYPRLRTIADLFAPDGELESFTPQIHDAFFLPGVVTGFLLLVLGIALIVFRPAAMRCLGACSLAAGMFWQRIKEDARKFIGDLRGVQLPPKERILLAAFTLAGLAARLPLLSRPVEYDEAYTFYAFARRPFAKILSDYHVPNNHILHTIFVRITSLLLGDDVWQIRLTALAAGLLLIPAVYLLGRLLYNRRAGWIAAGIVAFLPVMVLRSVSARGYSLLILLTVLAFILAGYVIRKRNLAAWALMAVVCALGFYTIPIMLYPFSALCLWLLLSVFDMKHRPYHWKQWLKYLSVAVILVGILSVLLYLPVLLKQDLADVYKNNRVLHALPFMDFLRTLPDNFQEILWDWSRGAWPAIAMILVAPLTVGLFCLEKTRKYRIPLQAALALATMLVLLVQRPDSLGRIWLWALPLLAIWSAFGIQKTADYLFNIGRKSRLAFLLPTAILAALLCNTAWFTQPEAFSAQVEDPVAEEVALFLAPLVGPDNLVVVSQCADARYWYYFYRSGIPASVFYDRRADQDFEKIYLIAYPVGNPSCGSEVVADVLSQYGPASNRLDLDTMKAILEIDYATVYEFQAIEPAVSETE
ncbi:MAG: hypothetical protein FJZ96_07720 [Chloroflexi bacterium]|nr:hypothetical protein [Chloroflexota bacterium]